MITADPLSRSAITRLCTNSIDPTSSPRVGWLAMNSFSGRDSSRASTTFCWLPPDSDDAVSLIPVVFRTTDGGSTWDAVSDEQEYGALSGVAFSDAAHAWAVATCSTMSPWSCTPARSSACTG
jgi:photosystem II stability/assembly factor-like uncharacterized protein